MRPSSLNPDNRINAISVPKIRPPNADRPVNVSVKVMPSKNRYPSERRMTSKSKLANIGASRSEEHTSELQSHSDLVCRLLLEKKNKSRLTGPAWQTHSEDGTTDRVRRSDRQHAPPVLTRFQLYRILRAPWRFMKSGR